MLPHYPAQKIAMWLLRAVIAGCVGVMTDAYAQPAAPPSNDCVVVLHGMGRTAVSMATVADNLTRSGYTVWSETYESLSDPIETLSHQTISQALQFCRQPQRSLKRIHFVTHSLGGILLRYYLQENALDELGKIVMLSPPNHGSEVVDKYRDNWLFRAVMGPAFLQLGTDGLVTGFDSIAGEIGIITGDKSSDPWFSQTIPGPDDGKVSVESAKLDEMQDFLIVPVGHTFIMNDDEVNRQLLHFLQHGSFRHPD